MIRPNRSGILNDTLLTMSDKYNSVNERAKEISTLMKLHIRGVWKNAYKFIRLMLRNIECVTVKWLGSDTTLLVVLHGG